MYLYADVLKLDCWCILIHVEIRAGSALIDAKTLSGFAGVVIYSYVKFIWGCRRYSMSLV